jgi:hypothetical protein
MGRFNDSSLLNDVVLRAAEIAVRALESASQVQPVGQVRPDQVPRITKADIDRLRAK